MTRLPRTARLGVTVAALAVAVSALLLVVVFPSGASSAVAAATGPLRSHADPGTVRVLATRPWGDGELVLVRFDRRGERMLRLAYTAHRTRGWRSDAATERRAELSDVAVASLMVARSPGGKGQPAWTAAAGELGDNRIARVEVRWTTGPKTTDYRKNDAYLVVQAGTLTAKAVRYIAANGAEIANVPVPGA